MAQNREKEVRWDAGPGIPETLSGDFALESREMGHLDLKLKYEQGELLLAFSQVRAFRVFWDGDNVTEVEERPRKIWPILLVEHSEWLASREFLQGYGPYGGDAAYRHFRVLTQERHIDISARYLSSVFYQHDTSERWLLRADQPLTRSISAIKTLARRHVPLIVAKRHIEDVMIGQEVCVRLPMPADASAFETELRELGIIALRQASTHRPRRSG